MKNFIKFLLCAGLAFTHTPAFSQNYNLQLRSSLTFPGQTLANICGYTQNGKEYALLGASKGLIIVDVTNPAAPQQIVQIPGPDNLWKEIKVYGHYAYVTSEGGQGLQIVDMSALPSPTVSSHFYTGDGAIAGQLNRIHALHIDVKKGFCYLFGGGQAVISGATVLDLKNDPYNPTYVGEFDQLGYVHDGFAENDTLYAAHINSGIMSIVDMSDKSNPVVLGTVETPGKFTHNTWLLDDHKHILTTDEKFPSFLTAYDVSDPEDIRELDRISTNRTGANSIGHNTHVLNDWAITSWYTDGFNIVDAHRPENLVEVARYDTWAAPVNLQDPFDGCWGVYPFFPSGTIVTSDIDPGMLNVFTPTYVRACYLEGKVLSGCDGNPLFGATIEVNTPEVRVNMATALNGTYKTGQVTPGNYTVKISKPGFASQTIPFTFATAQVTEVNVTLLPQSVTTVSGTVTDASTGLPISNAAVQIFSATQSFDLQTNGNGQFSKNCIAVDNYQATVGAWGYLTETKTFSGSAPLNISLTRGYYDDFQIDLGWEASSTATSGDWEIGDPIGTYGNGNIQVNPENDAIQDNNDQCYVTGNGGGSQGGDDVDGGSVTLTCPAMDLAGYNSAVLSFYYWFYNGGGAGTAPNDNFKVNLLIDGQAVPILTETVSASQWRFSGDIPLPAAALASNNVRVEFIATDNDPGHLVEAAVDIFKVVLGSNVGTFSPDQTASISAAPNPSHSNFLIRYDWENAASLPIFEVRNMLGQVVFAQNMDAKSGVVFCGNNWAPGVYFATLRSGGTQAVPVKLVKQ